jgi:cell volume regulation protein A
MLTVGALFVIAGFVEMPWIGGSAVVASLVFGLVLGNRRFFKRWLTSFSIRTYTDDHIHHFQTEITFFVRTFFYVYIGLLFDFASFTATQVATAVGVIVIIVVVRRLTSLLAYRIGDLDREDADALFSLMPRGLASAVLATVPALMLTPGQNGWSADYGPFVINVVLMVILGTTVLATVLSFHTERKIDRRNRKAIRTTLKNGGSVIRLAE